MNTDILNVLIEIAKPFKTTDEMNALNQTTVLPLAGTVFRRGSPLALFFHSFSPSALLLDYTIMYEFTKNTG